MCRNVHTTTNAASGRLSQNAYRQSATWMSQPPTSGPTAVATPDSPDQAPIALGRSSGWKLAWISASEPGVSSAPPTPCRARAATSTSMLGASPHSADATANQHTPTRNTRRRPNRSPSEPPSRISAASVSV
jgi:hypothetical protein